MAAHSYKVQRRSLSVILCPSCGGSVASFIPFFSPYTLLCVFAEFLKGIFATALKGKKVPFYAKFAKTHSIAANRLIVRTHPTVSVVQLSFLHRERPHIVRHLL